MIISPGRKYIFVHIPKTGGTSLSLALEDRAMKDDILIGDTPKAKRRKHRLSALNPAGRLWKHASLADIAGVVDPRDFFVVTLVRNPWDRAVSYYHWLNTQGFDHPAVSLAKTSQFSDFVCHPQTQNAFRANPYGRYVQDADGHEQCQLFARLENLSEDLAPFWAHLGFRCTIGRANASARKADWRSYYRPVAAAVIADVCAQDIARFGYVFE